MLISEITKSGLSGHLYPCDENCDNFIGITRRFRAQYI